MSDATLWWHFGELPARRLARRGILLDVIRMDQKLDVERIPMAPPGARGLFDASTGTRIDVNLIHRLGGRVLIAVDDDWWHPTPWSPSKAIFSAAAMQQLDRRLRVADGIVVPTPRLAEITAPFGPPITIIPLVLPPIDELPRRRERLDSAAGLRVGWVGTWTHKGDLEMIGPAVLEVLAQRPDVTFVLAGQCVPSWAEKHPQIEVHRAGAFLPGYYAWICSLDLDVFLCPLASGYPWNEAKPCLKPMEAAGLGLPVIASRVGAYADELRDEETALLAEDTTQAWSVALTRVIEDPALRAHLAAAGRAWAATRTIEQTGPAWEKLWG